MKRTFTFYIVTLFQLVTISLSAQVEVDWLRTYGGLFNDYGLRITTLNNGDLLLTGYTESQDGDFYADQGMEDAFIMRVDQNGDIIWNFEIGGDMYDAAFVSTEDSYGDIYVTLGSESSNGTIDEFNGAIDFWLIKLDADGNLLFKKNISGAFIDIVRNIFANDQDELVLFGAGSPPDYDETSNLEDFWILTLDLDGNKIAEYYFGGLGGDSGTSAVIADDGSYIICGVTSSEEFGVDPGARSDAIVVKMNPDFSTVWTSTFGGTEGEIPSDVVFDDEGNLLLVGITTSNDGVFDTNSGLTDIFVAHLDFETGSLNWTKTYGGSEIDTGETISKVGNGYVIAGNTRSIDGDFNSAGLGDLGDEDMFILGLDGSGNIDYSYRFGGSGRDVFRSVSKSSNDELYFIGNTTSDDLDIGTTSGFDVVIGRFSFEISSVSNDVLDISFSFYPNPSTDNLNIMVDDIQDEFSISIYDSTGLLVLSDVMLSNKRSIDVSSLSKGLYTLSISYEHNQSSSQFIKD